MRMIQPRSDRSAVQILLEAILGGLVTTLSTSVQAQENFSNTGIQFDVDTVIEFEFVESNGAYQSSFGVINLDTGEKIPLLVEVKPSDSFQNVETPSTYTDDTGATRRDFKGTPGNTVLQALAEFKFKANTRYGLYLESSYAGRPAGIVYSTDVQNSAGNQQTRFEGGITGLANGGTLLRWDDTGSVLVRDPQEDKDFDDFIIRTGGYLACPFDKNGNSQNQTQANVYQLGQGSGSSQTACHSRASVQEDPK